MNKPRRTFKLSGMIAPEDQFHQFTTTSPGNTTPDEHYLAPTTIPVQIISPPGIGTIGVPQYSSTVNGPSSFYDPAGDCEGNFMSSRFQPNNNCYAYACNIASNTFPQPGRKSGYLLTPANMVGTVASVGATVSSYAEKDGLILVGTTMEEVRAFTPPSNTEPGHFVALMISPAGDANWQGDYHWARCSNSFTGCDEWSQKDGSDQITNFDFAGNFITDPSIANWTVNQGPVSNTDVSDMITVYSFYCFMYASNPSTTSVVNII
ncbi:hypothetical protein ACLI09_08595 [Flavobacterium sp. RHBU_24]|uniref:hypothetical protein n=1 Tax=Flavobacterium sp. RHBU_24 TaxID=3391185 RepID=UPI003984CD8B